LSKRIYIIAGEASGDLHGSNLMKALQAESSDITFRFWGGDRMNALSDGLVKHIRDLAFMGFLEVIKNIRTILGNIRFCKEDIESFKPDALVLIDYPGFNLRIAEWAHEKGIPVYYYISPQVWAWKESRVKKIKKNVDHMFVILPFEQDFYAKHGMEVEYVGHPLLDAIEQYEETATVRIEKFREKHGLNDRPIIALLPGSRKQEIEIKLPIMLEAARKYEDFNIVVAGAPTITDDFYGRFLSKEDVLSKDDTYALLSNAEYALVTSGTATLETALFGVPEVVCYKGSSVSYAIAKRLVKIKYISLVNLIMDKLLVTELIQHDCTPSKIRKELDLLINDQERRSELKLGYKRLREKLGGGGASKKVAQSLLKSISK
jgi:lipid-A-disaccharide synthase